MINEKDITLEWDCRNKNIVRMKKFLDEIIGQEETVKQNILREVK